MDAAIETGVPPGFRAVEMPGGFEELVGPFYFRKEDNGVVFALRALQKHANPNGIIHGGMLMTLADHTMGALVWHGIGRRPCATVSMESQFVAGGKVGDWIEARAELTRQGRSLVFVRGRLTTGERTLLTASGIWKVLGG
jgi:acyl-coenzyme A thioesterase PaaI-like protein